MWIEGAVIGDGSVIEDNARIVYSLLDKKCKIGNDATVMPWSVFGEEVGDAAWLMVLGCGHNQPWIRTIVQKVFE